MIFFKQPIITIYFIYLIYIYYYLIEIQYLKCKHISSVTIVRINMVKYHIAILRIGLMYQKKDCGSLSIEKVISSLFYKRDFVLLL